jgi:hypothetical protein
MKVRTSHTFPLSAASFWKDIYFHKDYNTTLYKESIHAKAYDLVEFTETDTEIRKKVRVVPEQSAPKIIQKLISGEFSYTEEGTFSKKDGIYRFRITPSVKPDKIAVTGVVTVKAEGKKSVTRTIEVDLKADIFAIGGQIEKFVGDQIEKGYNSSYDFTLKWIKDHNL